MHVRNTHVQKFTQTTFLGHFFTQTTLRVSIFTHYFHSVGVVPVSRVKIWEKT